MEEGFIMEAESEGFEYYAFISYSHKDKKIAQRLHKRLRSYHLPSKLVKSHPELPKKLGDVFLDEANLVAKEGSLTESLRGYLDNSNYLILICSPDSARSPYVNDEVEYFMSIGRRNHIVPLIVRGIPRSKDPDAECFVPAILNLSRELEPLGIDLKTYGERDSFLRVIATTLGLDLDNFISIEARERRKKMMIFSSMAAVFVMFLGVLVWYNFDAFRTMYDVEAQFNLGEVHFKNQDYAQAVKWYQRAADSGYIKAQKQLFDMYNSGFGVEKDEAKAIEWLKKAADVGDAEAQCELGDMYYLGQHVEQDYAQATEWYKKAANNGYRQAQYSLGDMYYFGQYVEQDYVKATEWYRKTADTPDDDDKYIGDHYRDYGAFALHRLGDIYKNGLGVEKDLSKAKELYKQADAREIYGIGSTWIERIANNDNGRAQCRLGEMYHHGMDEVEKNVTKAIEWYEKAANNGNAQAAFALYEIYNQGWDVKKDKAKALEWYKKAADNGLDEAQEILRETEVYSQIAEQYKKAAADGDTEAQIQLGLMFIEGLGVEQDYAKAKELFEIAAASGDAFAQGCLAEMYFEGLGVEQNYTKARKLFEIAANKGIIEAQYRLGDIYRHGLGVERDHVKAKEWYDKANAQDNQ